MNLYNIWVSLSEMSDKQYWPFSWYNFFLRCTCSYHVVFQIHTIKYVLPFWIIWHSCIARKWNTDSAPFTSELYIYCLHSHINDSHINGNPPSMFSVIYSSLHTARRLCVWQLLKWPIFSICGSVSCLFATNPQAKIFVHIYSEEKIRQTLRKLPLLCSLRWRPVVDSKDIDGYICMLFEEDMLFLKRLWGWWSKKSTLKELNFGALDVSEYAIMPQRVGTPAEVLATSLFFFWIN